MKVLFLDIDGVLNGHEKLADSVYCGIHARCMKQLNRVVRETGCKFVISSAWRYQILCGACSSRGFEFLLFSHGLRAEMGTVIGHTPSDEVVFGRENQIRAGLYSLLPRRVESWAVVDDDPMQMNFGDDDWRVVRTLPDVGLCEAGADHLIGILNGTILGTA